ncbi:MAG: beta-ketoacyl-ACP synthase II [Actinomycetota bacterium]
MNGGVVVTGIGTVTPLGIGSRELWEGLLEGRSGGGPIESFDASDLPVRIASEIKDFDPTVFMAPKEAARADRFVQFATAASAQAWDDAGGPLAGWHPDRTGVIIGSGIGGLQTIEREHDALRAGGPRRVSPFMVPKLMPNGAAAAVAMKFGLTGPNFAVSSACATGAHAIGEAARQIRTGAADVMLAGGSEAAITPLAVAAFARMGALSRRNDDPTRASRPFDAGRDGFVFGEGAAVLVLESREEAERRGARILATLAGYGLSCDAHHVTQPDPDGRGAEAAMTAALTEAGVAPNDLDYINAHGTSTPFNDRIETHAIKSALGVEAKRIPVSSSKSQLGHLLGAAGAVEAAISVLAIRHQMVPPTINLEESDPDCDLDYVAEGPRPERIRTALSNSFGFGGQNAVLVLTAN